MFLRMLHYQSYLRHYYSLWLCARHVFHIVQIRKEQEPTLASANFQEKEFSPV